MSSTTAPHKPHRLDWVQPYLNTYEICPLCDGKTWRLIYHLGVLKVYQCHECRLMFLNPCLMPQEQKMIFSSPEMLQKVSAVFADYHDDSSWATPRTTQIHHLVLNHLEKHKPAKGQILDVGCGKGSFLLAAKERGWQPIGLEPNFNAAESLRLRDIHAHSCDFFDAAVEETQYDVISLWDLIEHTPNPKAWMRRCYTLLKPGGFLVIATPNHRSLLDQLAGSFRRFVGDALLEKLYTVDHTLYLTDETLHDLYLRTDFKVLDAIKVNTDLSRYRMSMPYRIAAEGVLMLSSVFHLQNRVVMIGQK